MSAIPAIIAIIAANNVSRQREYEQRVELDRRYTTAFKPTVIVPKKTSITQRKNIRKSQVVRKHPLWRVALGAVIILGVILLRGRGRT